MSSPKYSWLSAPSVRRSWLISACVIWAGLGIYIYSSDLNPYLNAKITYPLDYFARDQLGRSVTLNEKLKIYAIDDSAFSKMDHAFLTTDIWSQLLTNIAANKPRAIVIDGMFTKTSDPYGELETALTRMKDVDVPIFVGAYLTSRKIQFREELNLTGPQYELAKLLGKEPSAVLNSELPPLVDREQWFVYGPTPELRPIFKEYGHISYVNSAKVGALMQLSKTHVLPHLGLRLSKNLGIKDNMIMDEGTPIPVDMSGELILNLMPPAEFYKRTFSMRGILSQTLAGKSLTSIEQGDVVFLIPQMFTGNTDFKMTPYGSVPGGMIVATVMNSLLNKDWLKPLQGTILLILTAALLAAFIAAQLSAGWFWVALVGGAILGLAGSIYFFSFHNIVVPWLYPGISFLGTGLSLFALKTWVGERKALTLRQAFQGAIPDADLKSLIRRPEKLNFEARERVVSIVFIDIVGFSLLAENMLPRTAFESLKLMLGRISDTIHQYGGIIDKTLGDGLLCYFGYRLEDDSVTTDHAEKALRCAIKIQEQNIKRNIEAASTGEHVYPLRIGINTASCYIGDLASGDAIDFTVVGNGVNFAKRLEGACDMHSVLMGSTTQDLVKGIGLPPAAITKRFIRIKHHSELVEAFEFDPFYQEPDLRKVALEAFRKCANIERIEQRWPVRDPSKIQLSSDFGVGELVNFSHKGLSVKFKQLLVKGTSVNLSLDAAGGILKSLLAKEGVHALHGEVRWGYDDGSGFVHGIMVQNLTDSQSERLVEYLCEFAFSRDGKRHESNVS